MDLKMRSCPYHNLLSLLFFFYGWSLSAQKIDISIFNEVPAKTAVVTVFAGGYKLYGDQEYLGDLVVGDAIYLSMIDKRITIRNSKMPIGLFSKIYLLEKDTSSIMRVNLVNPSSGGRPYNDNLKVSVAFNRLLLVNEITPDHYIAGVVEAESGGNAEFEFYKAQSILARTYLYGHFYRHETEGFQLCDAVHCQAYHGRAVRNPLIAQATKATSGLVVEAPDSSFITAVFHANCGGQTESAANAWLNGKPYLQPVKDPYCLNSSSARWNKTIPLDQWKVYLKDHGMKLKPGLSPGNFDFTQITRRLYYKVGKDSIPLKQIRSDFQLKSTFFSVVATPKEVTINGKGFGHGVGLCQEGAMQMAKIGFTYKDILAHYYKNVRIVPYGQVTKLPSSSLDKQTASE